MLMVCIRPWHVQQFLTVSATQHKQVGSKQVNLRILEAVLTTLQLEVLTA